ncbi:hypothetical protein M413DRAFT_442394 [Hebeloma cylindrosporum]|uniref:Uncharacterized protein n=1 Tax=Hebeloma cylindrosporum TaxID=76867 RepID=A0A0C3C691_HEBCY|nr:hypothetical protein M413DRAFT_442394 [Hebeloma cylindrosporum h7]
MAKVLHSSGVGEVLDLVMDRFHPRSSSVPPAKFSCDDLDLRLLLLRLAGTHRDHLPTDVRVH